MPHIVNGCGTWYYGKRNREEREGVCRHCHRTAKLTSYDTRLYVVALMIPVFPLRKRRIIEQCGVCKRHLALPLKEWQVAQDRSRATIDQYRTARRDAAMAEECLRACLGYRDRATFGPLADELASDFADNPRILCMIAAGHTLFGGHAEAEQLLRRALALADDAETREMLAETLLNQGRPEEAEPLLAHIVDHGIPDRVDNLYALARTWQFKGEHERALAVFDQCEALLPQLAEDRTFTTLRAASRKRLGTHTSVNPRQIAESAKAKATLRKVGRALPVVLVIAFAAYCALAWIEGNHPDVYLVNGASQAYQVRLGDKTYALPPVSVTKADVPEGETTLEFLDAADPLPAETVALHSRFLTRPFARTVFVINPDRSAVLHRLEAYYGKDAPDAKSTLFAGETVHRLDGIFAPFEELPQSISSSFGAGTESRVGLYLVGNTQAVPAPMRMSLLIQTIGKDRVTPILQRCLAINPDDSMLLDLLTRWAEPQAIAEYLKPHLQDQPLRVDWHRAYQEALSQLNRDEEVEQTYATLLAAKPDDPDLLYLAGRACRDNGQARALCQRAIDSGAPAARAHAWFCSYELANARFDPAIQHGRAALPLLANKRGIRYVFTHALMAMGEFGEAVAVLQEEINEPYPYCNWSYRDLIYAHSRLAQSEDVVRVTERFRREAKKYGDDDWIRFIDADAAYVQGDYEGYASLLAQASAYEHRIAAEVTRGNLDAAEQIASDPSVGADQHLQIYLAAWLAGDAEMTQRQRDAAIEKYAQGNREERLVAEALRGGGDGGRCGVHELILDPREKVLCMTAVGVANESCRADCLPLAEKLNTDLRYPHELIAQALAAAREREGHAGPG